MGEFKTSLFDFDFEAESRERSVFEAVETREAYLASLMDGADDGLPSEPAYIIEARLEELRSMARRALDADRMAVYFRILDEIERWEAAEPIDAEMAGFWAS